MIILIFTLLTSLAHALPEVKKGDFKLEVSGNLEGQTRQIWNQSAAKQSPLNQDWNDSSFNMAMGNINVKADFRESRVEANWFNRIAQSPLYKKNYLAPKILNFPKKLVAREIFHLDHTRQDGDSQIDSVINKLYYELDGEDSRFSIGRLYINYGAGEVFNPINPFNQPLGLVSQSNVAQGNDGMKAAFFMSENASISFYLLGNKQLEDYENQITRTLWMHGEYRKDDLQIDYVIGEDQRRTKFGGQASYVIGDGMIFAQTLRTSKFINNKPSQALWDVMIGYDHQLTGKWHLRVEGGYQDKDNVLLALNPYAVGERFLPYQRFLALAQTYEIHPLVKLSGTAIYDLNTHFTYALARASWSVYKDVEWDLFVTAPLYTDETENNYVQKLLPTEAGTALRVFF
ncbi:MAG: hypothetical protein K2P81_05865 [Bacteriovoracaceae bacterium]|nr:hypothetical protein [Bacteriovoracaceae bacterium]